MMMMMMMTKLNGNKKTPQILLSVNFVVGEDSHFFWRVRKIAKSG